jgi:hypothetical protein
MCEVITMNVMLVNLEHCGSRSVLAATKFKLTEEGRNS